LFGTQRSWVRIPSLRLLAGAKSTQKLRFLGVFYLGRIKLSVKITDFLPICYFFCPRSNSYMIKSTYQSNISRFSTKIYCIYSGTIFSFKLSEFSETDENSVFTDIRTFLTISKEDICHSLSRCKLSFSGCSCVDIQCCLNVRMSNPLLNVFNRDTLRHED